ncbi:MAG TPA: hypothetical protein VJ698_17015 [Noviherbaspirillum sp.]|uniref:hypothetical protein n=1 Tax=Noviherbaspirillum sp. TaxID=1926288 RepID=UPI002B46DE27|nr:hypothetical protein [Noviherbaspirillum sp.]HJV87169.1 hypothetical protein [Noviherbaspirillum sp.]
MTTLDDAEPSALPEDANVSILLAECTPSDTIRLDMDMPFLRRPLVMALLLPLRYEKNAARFARTEQQAVYREGIVMPDEEPR